MVCTSTPSRDVGQDLHGDIDVQAAVLRKKLSRDQVLAFFAQLPVCVVAMEACGGAHFWGRELAPLGYHVRLIPRAYVKIQSSVALRLVLGPIQAAAQRQSLEPGALFSYVKRPHVRSNRAGVQTMDKTVERLLIWPRLILVIAILYALNALWRMRRETGEKRTATAQQATTLTAGALILAALVAAKNLGLE
jgi:hypothetical protein